MSAGLVAVVDTNILVRYVTGDPAGQARRATRFLNGSDELVLTDVVVAELVYVLESFYGYTRGAVFVGALSVLALPTITAPGYGVLLRTFDLYRTSRIGFADAYILAVAEQSKISHVASFDRGLDPISSVERVEP